MTIEYSRGIGSDDISGDLGERSGNLDAGQNEDFDFDEIDLIERLTDKTMSVLGCPYEVSVSVTVVDEDEMHSLNLEHREIDAPTDVLSFPMNEFDDAGEFEGEVFEESMALDPESGELMLGDIVLCADRIRAQAKEYGHSELREYAFLVVHSLLHLSGLDHEEDDEREQMEDMQRLILDELDISR